MAVITFEEMKKLAIQEIELPGFTPGTTITVEVRRTSMTKLVSSGKIPNSLMGAVQDLFGGSRSADEAAESAMENMEKLGDIAKLMDIFVEATLVNPKYSEVKDLLTDDQTHALFEYANSGVAEITPIGEE